MSRKEFKLGFLQSEKSKMTLLSQCSGNAANKNNTYLKKIILQSYIYIQLREKAEGRMCGKERSQKTGVASLNLPPPPFRTCWAWLHRPALQDKDTALSGPVQFPVSAAIISQRNFRTDVT